MSRNDAVDPEVAVDRDETGGRLLVAVESNAAKLVVMVPDDVSRSKIETTATDWIRELVHRVEPAGSDGAAGPADGRGSTDPSGEGIDRPEGAIRRDGEQPLSDVDGGGRGDAPRERP